MILDVLAEVLIDALTAVAGRAARGVASAVLPRRRPTPERPWPKPVIVGAGAMFDRAALYATWAAAHGLEPTEQRGAEYAGTYRGRRTEMVTGLVGTSLPRSPEILVRIALAGLERLEGSVLLERGADLPPDGPLRALATLLEIEGVRDIGVTCRFVRLRFDAFAETTVFDDALQAFDAALEATASLATTPYR